MIRNGLRLVLFGVSLIGFLFVFGNPSILGGGKSRFDKLNETDRQGFSARFEKEIWPLLIRNGKNGCVGCHTPKHQSGLRFRGNPDPDFRKILSDGFLLVEDPGSMLSHVSTKNKRLRMPPNNLPPWSNAEIDKLRTFVKDVAAKQQK